MKRIIFLITLFVFFSCTGPNNVEETLVRKSEEISQKFMNFDIAHKFDSMHLYVHQIDYNSIKNQCLTSDSILGEILKYQLVETIYNKSVKMTEQNWNLEIYYNVLRKKKKSTRIFYFEKIKDSVKIVGYEDKFDVNSKK